MGMIIWVMPILYYMDIFNSLEMVMTRTLFSRIWNVRNRPKWVFPEFCVNAKLA